MGPNETSKLLLRIYKELSKLNSKKINSILRKSERHFTKEDIQMTNKHMKWCSRSYVIRGMQVKTTMRYPYTPIRVAKLQNTDSTKY